ncbi:MAG: hypothetical protein ACYC5O_09235 [Anaerolineae bacterium]
MPVTVADLMPKIKLGPHSVSRLIVGGNPFSGNSHYSGDLDGEMRQFHTVSRVLEALREAEKWGVTAFQSRGDAHMMRLMTDYWGQGGKLIWIVQTASEMADIPANIRAIARTGAVAIYHHGTRTDSLWKQGRQDEVRDTLTAMRDTGVLVGLGTHMPEVVRTVEDAGWDVDFYMACVYNLSRTERESALVSGRASAGEVFLHEDRDVMCSAIREVAKPVLAFKILAASRLSRTREDLDGAFRHAFANIKPTDAVVTGVFCKYGNQVAANARLTYRYGAPATTRTDATTGA